ANDGVVADRQQVGAHGNLRGQDQHVSADLRAQRPQVENEYWRTDEQGQRVRSHQRFDEPETKVVEAPDANLLGLPSPHENPLRQDRKETHAEESRAARQERPPIDIDETRTGGYPLVA